VLLERGEDLTSARRKLELEHADWLRHRLRLCLGQDTT